MKMSPYRVKYGYNIMKNTRRQSFWRILYIHTYIHIYIHTRTKFFKFLLTGIKPEILLTQTFTVIHIYLAYNYT